MAHDFSAVPEELQAIPRWILWRWARRGDDLVKVPTRPNQKLAAELKHKDRARYEKLYQTLNGRKVPRLPQFDKEVDRIIREAKKAGKAKKARRDADGFVIDQDGRIIASQDNIRLAIENLGVALRYDDFRSVPIVEGLDGFGPTLDDPSMNRLWLLIDEHFELRPSMALFTIVVTDNCYRNRFHPVVEYLDGLRWDGVDQAVRAARGPAELNCPYGCSDDPTAQGDVILTAHISM